MYFFFFTLMGARKRSRILTANTRVSGYSCSLLWSSVNQRTASSRWAGEMSVSYNRTIKQLNISPMPWGFWCWPLNHLFLSIFPLRQSFPKPLTVLYPFRHSNSSYIPPSLQITSGTCRGTCTPLVGFTFPETFPGADLLHNVFFGEKHLITI